MNFSPLPHPPYSPDAPDLTQPHTLAEATKLSLSYSTLWPRETAEDQGSFCRSHLNVDEQFKQRARCELKIPENWNSLSAVIAFNGV